MGGCAVSGPVIAILSGGVSAEREVSQRSAAAIFEALHPEVAAELFDVTEPAVPPGTNPGRHVIFSTLHGSFGEDGGMQELLEKEGFAYAGSDSRSSRLCMDKTGTKEKVAAAGVRVTPGLSFDAAHPPEVEQVIDELGADLVLKPNSEGSSIGLHFVEGASALAEVLGTLSSGRWLVESRVEGREITVGLLDGRAMGIVEIVPRSGRYDYSSKYTSGLTEYVFPAPVDEELAARIRRAAETVFATCGCRDFARVDSILTASGEFYFLEINTLPGLTETSLLPKSALCENLPFPALARKLVDPAIARFNEITSKI